LIYLLRMRAIILAAGYGTRLGMNVPKHLVKVAGKEMLLHLLEKLDRLEIDEVTVVTNDWGYEQTLHCLAQNTFRTKVQVLNDGTMSNETRLGSLGDVLFTREKTSIDEDVLIIAGDNLFEFSLAEFIAFFKEKGDCLVLFDVKDKEVAKRMGIAAVDDKQKIVDFVEKPDEPPSTLAATLCYLFTADTLTLLENYKASGRDMDKAGSFIEYLHKEKDVFGWVTDKIWFDIGDKQQLEKADKYFS